MIGVGRIGCRGRGARPVRRGDAVCLFVPSDVPSVLTEPGDHVPRAVRWALTVLGHGHRGGTLLVLVDGTTPPAAFDVCLAAAMAVDDAIAGGHRPGAGPGAGLVEHLLVTPQALAALTAATGLTPS